MTEISGFQETSLLYSALYYEGSKVIGVRFDNKEDGTLTPDPLHVVVFDSDGGWRGGIRSADFAAALRQMADWVERGKVK